MATIIKIKPGEDLSPGNITKVIKALEDGATKKLACEHLGIAYNTKRLQAIIDSHCSRLAFEKTQKAKRRGKPVLNPEAASIIESYLTDGSIESAAKSHYRSAAIIKETLLKHGAMLKSPKTDYFHPQMLPDQCVVESLEVGELVWSSRYNSPAEVIKWLGGTGYRIWILGENSQFAAQPIEELGSLRHLQELGVNITRIIRE